MKESWYNDNPARTDGGTEYPTSSTFGPMAGGSSQPPTDMLLLSSDSVMFYTNEEILLNASNNSFRHLLPFGSKELSQRVLVTDLSSSELEIVLRAIFDVPNSDVRPLIDVDVKTLTRAIDSLPEYGISPTACITPESNLYQLLLACAPLHPLEVYAQAAHHGLDSLATIVSSHTLVVNLAQLTDELSVKMGPVHALRLFQLHIGRVETLKRLLSHDIGLHDPTRYCDFDGQKVLKEKWNIGIAFMSTKIEPDTLTSTIREIMLYHTDGLTCQECNKLRDDRLRDLINEWTMASRSIAYKPASSTE